MYIATEVGQGKIANRPNYQGSAEPNQKNVL
jgi:hypothetical protein